MARRNDRSIRAFWGDRGKTPGCKAFELGPSLRVHSVKCKQLQKEWRDEVNFDCEEGDVVVHGDPERDDEPEENVEKEDKQT